MIFAINDCTVDTDTYEVRRHGRRVAVEPQVFDLLVQLLETPGRVVTKDEIIRRVWNGRIVSDAALSSRIKAVRQAIGDDGASQACIRTVRRRGFQVVAEVTRHSGGDCDAGPSSAPGAIETRGLPAAQSPDGSAPEGIVIEAGDKPTEARPGWTTGRRSYAVVAPILAVVLALGAGLYALRSERDPQLATAAALAMPAGPGIAVLRFDNISADSALSFFGNAITEEITNELTRYPELRIAARALTSDYDAKTMAVDEIGRRLGVEYLVQGTLQRSNGRMRVSARLLKARDGTVLWSESHERDLTPADVFSVQEDVAAKIVAAIASISGGVIAREKLGQSRGKAPRELSAYACTIRVNEIMTSGFSAESYRATRGCLEAAVASEPDYAAAWAMLAWVHTVGYSQDHNTGPEHPLEQALAAARRAVDLAPGNPMARFAMARTAYLMKNLELFRVEAAQTLRLNPNDPFLLGNLGSWLAFSGRWDDGVAMIRKAIVLNPKVYPRWWHAALGKNHYRKGEYQQALGEFKTMNLPNWWWNQVELAYTYGQLGDVVHADKAVRKLVELYPGFDLDKAVLEHRKFSFEQSYIDLAVDGLRKAGVAERRANDE